MKKTFWAVMMLAVFMVATTILGGCATYNTKGAVPILSRIEAQRLVKAEKEGITVTVFPIMTKEDSKRYFDENLLGYRVFGKRILAVYLNVFNTTSGPIKVASTNLKIGQAVIAPSTPKEVSGAIKREYAGKAFLWTFPTFFIGAVPSVIHTAVVNQRIEDDLENKQFMMDREIKARSSSEGFMWFQVPEKEVHDGLLPKGMVLNIFLGEEKKLVELPIS